MEIHTVDPHSGNTGSRVIFLHLAMVETLQTVSCFNTAISYIYIYIHIHTELGVRDIEGP